MAQVLEFPAQVPAERAYDAIQQLGGYPHPATSRGRFCPPHPFGVTERWAPLLLGQDGIFRIVFPGRLDGREASVRGQRVRIRAQDAVDRMPMDDDDDVTPAGPQGIEALDRVRRER